MTQTARSCFSADTRQEAVEELQGAVQTEKAPRLRLGAFYCSLHLFCTHFIEFSLDMRCRGGRSAAFITAETTATLATGLSDSTSMLSAFRPPIATTGIGTARQTSFSTETGATLVVTCVVVGKIAPVPR